VYLAVHLVVQVNMHYMKQQDAFKEKFGDRGKEQ
jgi:hypothetical protein